MRVGENRKMNNVHWKAWLAGRLPTLQQAAAVYGVVVLLIYSWTLYWYFWKLPSWLYFLNLGELFTAYAYALVVNLLESFLLLAVPLLVCVILPSRWFRERFVTQATIFVLLLALALMKYLDIITSTQALPPGLIWKAGLTLLGSFLIAFIVGRIAFLRKLLDEIAYRAVIFLYIFPPLSVASLIVVLIRNL